MTDTVPPWYKSSIGPRLKPRIQKVYETWSGLAGDELIAHLYHVVSIIDNLHASLKPLLKAASGKAHGLRTITRV